MSSNSNTLNFLSRAMKFITKTNDHLKKVESHLFCDLAVLKCDNFLVKKVRKKKLYKTLKEDLKRFILMTTQSMSVFYIHKKKKLRGFFLLKLIIN